MFRIVALILAAGLVSPVLGSVMGQAQVRASAVRFDNQVFVERPVSSADGSSRVILQPTTRFTSGDRLVFVTRFRNATSLPVRNYVLRNSVPAGVDVETPTGSTLEVSVDGGRHWGPLQALTVGSGENRRAARAEDVTHLRWVFAEAIAPGASGQVSYRGTVR